MNELYHYNHNHDKLGRFASSGGGKIKIGRVKAVPHSQKKKEISDEELTARVRRMNLEKQYEKLQKERRPKSDAEKLKGAIDETGNAVSRLRNQNREAINREKRNVNRLDLSKMTDKELRDKINRENLERQYNQLFNEPEISRGRKRLDDILDSAGTVLSVGSSALAIAIAIRSLRQGRMPN